MQVLIAILVRFALIGLKILHFCKYFVKLIRFTHEFLHICRDFFLQQTKLR